MRSSPHLPPKRRAHRLLAPVAAASLLLAACAGSASDAANDGTDAPAATSTDTADASADGAASSGDLGAVGTLASTEVHDISVEFDTADFEAMVETYTATGDKEWIEAVVTIDGATYDNVGLRLKGNSSLRGVTVSDDPSTLPWLIKLDKFVEDQTHDGLTALVVRSNSSATALNEAVALELLDRAGLASQDAIVVRFSVNGGGQVLRLAVDNPEDEWMAEEFDASGALYKAESTGDYSYRGDDPASYDEVFDQEAGEDNADLTPLIKFLDFINNADDDTFAAEIDQWLDVESFATYLAMQDLLDNFDDIDGPGNNSYLYYDTTSGQFTVVPWDYNLAFGARPEGGPGGEGGAGGPMSDFQPPDGAPGAGGEAGLRPPDGGPGAAGGRPGGGPMGGSNILVERFTANAELNALYQEKLTELRAELYDSGTAAEILAAYAAVVADSGLVEDATVTTESSAIESYLS